MRLPSLKYITQAGGKLSSELLDEFHLLCKKKIKLIIMYGQTEATGRISYLDWNHLNKKKEVLANQLKEVYFSL